MESRTQGGRELVASVGGAACWEAQPWRLQLQDARAREHRVARSVLVAALLAEGFTAEAEVAGFAGALEDRASLSIGQVLRFVDGLRVRMALACTDDEVLQLAYLRRNAEELAERMIDWANAGRLPA
ncbi:hypothetical protein D7V80_34155 [Corallococcus sp. CA054B]|uniref:hypothetical protein n=1 Tax=Corallococcus sp. CA054B TaxID=2316734 RepID=UPI000EC28576|nr:hypothetical protein [Corallococcus sp. CA054B]RKG61534.1 hypothetical protein D7V80_34155 [Corallococcus sp. CA054B]